MTAAIARMNRVLSDLDELANYFEDAGFECQSNALDGAAETVEDVRNRLEALASLGASHRRIRREGHAHAETV